MTINEFVYCSLHLPPWKPVSRYVGRLAPNAMPNATPDATPNATPSAMPSARLTHCLTLGNASYMLHRHHLWCFRATPERTARRHDMIGSMKVRLTILTTVKALPANRG
jgi:hypothetical protein